MTVVPREGSVAHQERVSQEESTSEQEEDRSIRLDYSWQVVHPFPEMSLS